MLKKLLFRIQLWFRPQSSARIFAFYDGSNWKTIDPLAVVIALREHPTYNDARHFRESYDSDPAVRDAAIQKMAEAACDAFGVQSYDSESRTGLTLMERVGLVRSFAMYLEALKKNIEASATAQHSTAAS